MSRVEHLQPTGFSGAQASFEKDPAYVESLEPLDIGRHSLPFLIREPVDRSNIWRS